MTSDYYYYYFFYYIIIIIIFVKLLWLLLLLLLFDSIETHLNRVHGVDSMSLFWFQTSKIH